MNKWEFVKNVGEIYLPNFRYLVNFETAFPKSVGIFSLNQARYTEGQLSHMTAIDAQFCLNQLAYATFAQWIKEKRFPELDVSLEKYFALAKENMLIADTKIRFKKPIETKTKVGAEIDLKKFRKQGNLFFAFLEQNFENGKEQGTLDVVLRLP